MRSLAFLVLTAFCAHGFAQGNAANAILLVAKPDLLDPNFRETVVLVTQTEDASTVGVILNRPTARRHEQSGDALSFGGPVMREVMVALFRAERAPRAAAFHVLKDVYLTMHPDNIDALLAQHAGNYRLFMGFSGWAPGQLQSEMARDGWYVLPANAEIAFRKNTSGMWEELVRKARGRVALR
jgi:putative transcriptional regulator